MRIATLSATAGVLLLAGAGLWFATRARPSETPREEPPRYVGADACRPCHDAIVEPALQTAHYRSSRVANAESVPGNFTPPDNVLKTSNPAVFFRMEARGEERFQLGVQSDRLPPTQSARFDLIIGSGRKGNTFLYWNQDRLFQLPVSYWTEGRTWVNSPGYPDGVVNFVKPVQPRCLECHATRFEPLDPSGRANQFKTSGFTLGITCEKCHGPASRHVVQYTPGGAPETAARIINTDRLSRERQIDLCALCHGGPLTPTAPPFSYEPGQRLDASFMAHLDDPAATPDVHGNQVGLLKRSRCFEKSEMTCTTCHDVHRTQRDTAAMSDSCLECHAVEACKVPVEPRTRLRGACVDCHMPAQRSSLFLTDRARRLHLRVRTHWIKSYPDATAETLKRIAAR